MRNRSDENGLAGGLTQLLKAGLKAGLTKIFFSDGPEEREDMIDEIIDIFG